MVITNKELQEAVDMVAEAKRRLDAAVSKPAEFEKEVKAAISLLEIALKKVPSFPFEEEYGL